MNNKKYISVFALITLSVMSILFLLFFTPIEKDAQFKSSFSIAEISDTIVSSRARIVNFKVYDIINDEDIHLILSGTYGTIALSPEITTWDPVFSIPPSFTKRAGVVSYYLVQDQKTIQKGTFKILPDTQKLGRIETYLGPRSIVANKRDYTMLVSIPADTLDNLLPDSTKINLKEQFKNTITVTNHNLTSGFAWKRIAAPLQTGRLSTGSTLRDHSSKELVADVFPDLAQNFSISSRSNHSYADGNEIITFETSQIKDRHGNTMSDGTLVTFTIKDASGDHWQVHGSTVNGYAFAKALHPQSPSTWTISAAITGIAQSEKISQSFAPIIETIPVTVHNKRTIVIGPLTSYLGQLVQEGIDVSLEIEGVIYTGRTKSGKATFSLKQEDHPKGLYTLKTKTLGRTHTQQITLD